MCLILAGIHCYLGLHVLARGVIFVDLSLAQVAAFGATLAIFFGFEHGSPASYLISLLCTFIAAALFALARRYEKLFSQEAIIGIVYALASAAVILVVDRVAHGAEHIKDILVGQLLWVTWHDVIKTSSIYGCRGLGPLYFSQTTSGGLVRHRAGPSGIWDFVFYALFGVVITSSVSVAGVLQVFAYLIVPPLSAASFSRRIRSRLIFGWLLGFVVSFAGFLSYLWDLPTGAFIVVCFASLPVFLLLLSPFKK